MYSCIWFKRKKKKSFISVMGLSHEIRNKRFWKLTFQGAIFVKIIFR